MSETHWIERESMRKRFWVFAKGDLGLTEDEVHEALGVESVKDFTGKATEAKAELQQFAIRKNEARLAEVATTLPESPIVAWTTFASDGFEWSFTVRAGLTGELRRAAFRQMAEAVDDFEKLAQEKKWLPAGGLSRKGREAAAMPRPVAQKSAPTGEGPPPPPTAKVPMPTASEGGNGREVMETEFIKITAPSGKPRIEFWRPNRRYAEIHWALGGEAFLKQVAQPLAQAGWTPEHFDAVGQEYTLPLRIEWQTSPKNDKWKDILSVMPRA